MKLEREAGIIEAILFLENEPVDLSTLARTSGLTKDVVLGLLEDIQKEYNTKEYHGLELIEIAGGYTFLPKKELWNFLKDRYGKKNTFRLSKAAMETLSIIAYSQPITKSEIENIRGVSSDSMIRLLQEKELVKTVGKKEAPGNPSLYGTTKEFLKAFRLKTIADLPKLDEKERERFQLNG